MEFEVTDNAAESRYEIRADGKLAGFSAYRGRPDALAFTHTEIFNEFEGQGVGSKLVGDMLDDVREQGLGVLPLCPFVKAFIERHPEYVDLVPETERKRFGL
jgi:predicted GNAT family acetyltransferase